MFNEKYLVFKNIYLYSVNMFLFNKKTFISIQSKKYLYSMKYICIQSKILVFNEKYFHSILFFLCSVLSHRKYFRLSSN